MNDIDRRMMMLQEICCACESNGYAHYLNDGGELILNCVGCQIGNDLSKARKEQRKSLNG